MEIDTLENDRVERLKQSMRLASPLRNSSEISNPNDAPSSKAILNEKRKKRSVIPGSPACNVVRGFEPTGYITGDESDVSRTGSPVMRAVSAGGYAMSRQASNQSGISMLKLQLDTMTIEESNIRGYPMTRTNSNIGSECGFSPSVVSTAASDSDRTEMDTYEVPLDQDYVSSDAGSKPSPYLKAIEGGVRSDSIHRKMAASDFKQICCLGKGAFGTVHLVQQHATGRLFAQKQFRKASLTIHKRLVEQTRTERAILESVNRHPFVVKLYYAFQDHERLYLILEYAQGGELFTHLAMERMFSEDVAAFYLAEMVLALEHLHTTVRVIYRDLKPENCLLDAEGHILLTDFGLSKVSLDEDGPCNSVLGTIEYMAPEVVQGKDYGFAVDWWSLGAIGFDMLTGSPPFQGGNTAKIQQNIIKQKLQLPYFLGPDAKDILTRLLRKEPNKRLGASMPKDLSTIKKHRFFRKIDWSKLERRELSPPIKPLITDPELAENFAKEFTDLPLNRSVGTKIPGVDLGHDPVVGSDPFAGFSYVASSSLLNTDCWMLDRED